MADKGIEMQSGNFDVNTVAEQFENKENVSEKFDAEQEQKIEAQSQAEQKRKDFFNSNYEPIDYPDENKDDRWYNKAWKWIKGGVGKAADTLSKPMADAARFVIGLTSVFITGVAWLGRTLFRNGHSKPNYKRSAPKEVGKGKEFSYKANNEESEEPDIMNQLKEDNENVKQKVDAGKTGQQYLPANLNAQSMIEQYAKNNQNELNKDKDNIEQRLNKNNKGKQNGAEQEQYNKMTL